MLPEWTPFTCSEPVPPVVAEDRSITSTRARAKPMPGTTHFPQLQRMPCHANLPIFPPQRGFGQMSRPSSGASSVPSEEFGYKHGRIHDSGCTKIWLQRSVDSVSCVLMTGFVANNRLPKKIFYLAPSDFGVRFLVWLLSPHLIGGDLYESMTYRHRRHFISVE